MPHSWFSRLITKAAPGVLALEDMSGTGFVLPLSRGRTVPPSRVANCTVVSLADGYRLAQVLSVVAHLGRLHAWSLANPGFPPVPSSLSGSPSIERLQAGGAASSSSPRTPSRSSRK